MAFRISRQHQDDSDDTRDDLADINMIPMIDVMLVLLITFMIAAPLSFRGIDINLPKTAAKGSEVNQQKVVVTVDKKGFYYIDKIRLSQEALASRLQDLLKSQPDRMIFVRADADALHGSVVRAMELAKLAGAQKLSILTSPKSREEQRGGG